MLVSAERDKIVDHVTRLFLIALQYRVATILHDGLCTELGCNYTCFSNHIFMVTRINFVLFIGILLNEYLTFFSRAEYPSIFRLTGIMQLYINLSFNLFMHVVFV